jgi:hypothetical protein
MHNNVQAQEDWTAIGSETEELIMYYVRTTTCRGAGVTSLAGGLAKGGIKGGLSGVSSGASLAAKGQCDLISFSLLT